MAAQITLSREDVLKLLAFSESHNHKEFFVAKDHGAYVGDSAGDKGNCIFYFAGCNPDKDKDWYDTCHEKFGGDDFGEHLPIEWLQRVRDNPKITKMVVKLTAKRIAADYHLEK